MNKKRLWGHEFSLVENGLAVEEVETFVKSLGSNADTWLEQEENFTSLKDLSGRMATTFDEVQKVVRALREEALQRAEQEKDSIRNEARDTARKIIAEAEESARLVKQEAEEVARDVRQGALEEFKRLMQEAEAVIRHDSEKIRRLLAAESRTFLGGLTSLWGDTHASASQVEVGLPEPRVGQPARLDAGEGAREPVQISESDFAESETQGQDEDSSPYSQPEIPAHTGPIQKEGAKPQSPRDNALCEGRVQIFLPRDVPVMCLFQIRQALETTKGVTILNQRAHEEGVTMQVLVESPTPLIQLLRGLPGVSDAVDMSEENGTTKQFHGPLGNRRPPDRTHVTKLRLITAEESGSHERGSGRR